MYLLVTRDGFGLAPATAIPEARLAVFFGHILAVRYSRRRCGSMSLPVGIGHAQQGEWYGYSNVSRFSNSF
jgi:hypothetical protein